MLPDLPNFLPPTAVQFHRSHATTGAFDPNTRRQQSRSIGDSFSCIITWHVHGMLSHLSFLALSMRSRFEVETVCASCPIHAV
jgi:hypothetical protein